jgi:alkanesulfonate monooxygenase SsuD/methylene tetrahydromethanopterin reductase-like flavin-dependent oxidoreductase (luciferase family)
VERRDHAEPQPVRQLRRRAASRGRTVRARARVHPGLPQALGQLGTGRGPHGSRHRRVRGPQEGAPHRARRALLQVPRDVVRSPQHGPAILQAGTSPKGRTFAARYADAIFAIQPNIAGAKAYYDDIKSGTESEGRPPEACKILFGIQPIIGRTEAEAQEKAEHHNRLVPLEGGLAILSGHLDFDLSALPLDTIMAHRTEPPLQRMQTRYRTLTGELLTLRDVAQRHGQSVGLLQMVGTPTHIADQMEDYFDQVGGDGFMLSPIYSPGAIEEFVDLVVPELQRRGRYRADYTGTTQRDHLMQED